MDCRCHSLLCSHVKVTSCALCQNFGFETLDLKPWMQTLDPDQALDFRMLPVEKLHRGIHDEFRVSPRVEIESEQRTFRGRTGG